MQSYLAQTNITSKTTDQNLDGAVQKLVLQGYKYCARRMYFVTFGKETASKLLLQGLNKLYASINPNYEAISLNNPGNKDSKFSAIDLAFSYSGLEKLGVREELTDVFRFKNPAFQENAFTRAQTQLGDSGWSDPIDWLDASTRFDLALIVHVAIDACKADGNEKITNLDKSKSDVQFAQVDTQVQDWMKSNQCSAKFEDASPLDFEGTVHFGFKDGITRPQYSDDTDKFRPVKPAYNNQHALGDILLGHERSDGSNPYAAIESVLRSYAPSQLGALTDTVSSRSQKALSFFRNSSFGVLRKMQQREDVWDAWLESEAVRISLPDAPTQPNGVSNKTWIKAKMLGRNPTTGEILTPAMSPQDLSTPKHADKNDLPPEVGFQALDPRGLGCPFSSHIRRMNPRDDPVVPFVARPLLRRGMPYADTHAKGDIEKGMSGLFLCADIEEQFEHLVGKWANGTVLGINDSSDCLDPLIGNHERVDSRLFINAGKNEDDKNYVSGFKQPFVVTRSCAYVWFPSVDTLKSLGDYIKA